MFIRDTAIFNGRADEWTYVRTNESILPTSPTARRVENNKRTNGACNLYPVGAGVARLTEHPGRSLRPRCISEREIKARRRRTSHPYMQGDAFLAPIVCAQLLTKKGSKGRERDRNDVSDTCFLPPRLLFTTALFIDTRQALQPAHSTTQLAEKRDRSYIVSEKSCILRDFLQNALQYSTELDVIINS